MALIRERKERYGERGNRLAGAFCYSSDCRTVDCGSDVNAHHEKTNYEQTVGKIVRITQRVDDLAQTGKGILDGMEWTVRTDSKEVLEKDTLARVIRISGVKLIVEPYKED